MCKFVFTITRTRIPINGTRVNVNAALGFLKRSSKEAEKEEEEEQQQQQQQQDE